MKSDYFVKFLWPNNWGEETFLAQNLIRDKRRLGYLAKRNAAFIHLKFGWHLPDYQPDRGLAGVVQAGMDNP